MGLQARPPLPRAPVPTCAEPSEAFKRSVCVEHLDRGAGQRVNVEKRLMFGRDTAAPYAVTSDGSANALPSRYSAAFEAWLHAVKKARLSSFSRSIQLAL